MAKPIKETPILYGEDARRFLEKVNKKFPLDQALKNIDDMRLDEFHRTCEDSGFRFDNKPRAIDRVVRFLFRVIWRKWLDEGVTIVKVHSWNSCTFDMKGGTRYRSTMCGFPWKREADNAN